MVASIIAEFIHQMVRMMWIWGVLVPIELAWPLNGQVSFLTRLRGVAFSTLFHAATAGFLVTIGLTLTAIGLAPIFALSLSPRTPAQHLALVLGCTTLSVLLFDFFYYWLHRAQHRWLWSFHSVHHAIEDLSAVSTYWHWTEELQRAPFLTVPLILLTPSGMDTLPWVLSLTTLQSYFVHSQTRLHLGPFWRIIMDNRFHRIHHSIEPRHYGQNFGVLIPLWDWMFGTLYVPAKNEWPPTGVQGTPEVYGLADYLWRPFRGRASVLGSALAD